MEGIYNHLQKIGNHVSEAFMILCITHTMPKEYSPYLFKFVGTCEEPMLMELYELVCKAEDNLRVKLDKTKKRKADDQVNDEQVTARPDEFFFKPVTKKITLFPMCYYCRKHGHKIGKCFEHICDVKLTKKERGSFRRKAHIVVVMIAKRDGVRSSS
ncbi:hypothetical protein Tco_1461658 [Tanacetum coccineum]